MSNANIHGADLMHVRSHHVILRSTSTGTRTGTGFSISRIRSALVVVFVVGVITSNGNLPGFDINV